LVLGEMCEVITDNYENAISQLTSILKLDTSFTRTEAEWANDENYALEFELGLWSLEALYKLQHSLKASVDSVMEAREKLVAQIIDGPGNRSVALERMCQKYLGEFDSCLVQLTAVNARLERKIELNKRHKEAFSAVLAMRDSRASLHLNRISLSQSSTIQRLTYLTIAYLPMGLMATIFAIPDTQKVVFSNMGVRWFVGAILIMSTATYLVATYLRNILDFIRYPPPYNNKLPPQQKDQPPNMWRWLRASFSGKRKAGANSPSRDIP